MRLNKTALKAGLAGAILFATAGMAFAAPAAATTNVNVRSGPGTSYSAIDTLRRGERVNVTGCRGGWCYVEKAGPDGWVSNSYLTRARTAAQPQLRFDFNFGNPPRFESPRRHYRDWDRRDRGGRHWDPDRRDRYWRDYDAYR